MKVRGSGAGSPGTEAPGGLVSRRGNDAAAVESTAGTDSGGATGDHKAAESRRAILAGSSGSRGRSVVELG